MKGLIRMGVGSFGLGIGRENGHENEWRFATDGSEEIGGISKKRPGIEKALKNQWRCS